ncbi:MAG: hypothetical protein KDK36_21610 [Leptospiraceae bacterium]|nr:hypothetical protein [Leptospiraceae bacterium]
MINQKTFLSILIFLFFIPHSIFSESKKIYVKNLDSKFTDSASEKRIQNLILLHTLKTFDNKLIMSDEAGKIILKQSKENQLVGAGDELLEILMNSLGFDELITSEVYKSNGNYKLTLNLIEVKKDSRSLNIKNKVLASFNDYNMDYFIGEAIKSLSNKNYIIDNLHAPLPISENFTGTVKIPKNQVLPSLSIQSSVAFPGSFLEGMNSYLREGDKKFKDKEYYEAAVTYEKILESIESLSKGNLKRLSKEIDSIKRRISNSYLYHNLDLMHEIDSEIESKKGKMDSDEIDSFIQKYYQEFSTYSSLPFYARDSRMEELYKTRLNKLLILDFSRTEEEGDEKYKNLKFSAALEFYESNLQDISKYSKILNFESYKDKIQKKIKHTKVSAKSYVEKTVFGYLLLADSENSRAILERKMGNSKELKNRKDNTENIMNKAYEILSENPEFVSRETLEEYNQLANEINEDNRNDTVITTKNILLLPFRYVYNISRGITDIFVFKIGTGLGFGGEFLFFGATPFQLSAMQLEASSAYGVTNKIENSGPLTRLSDVDDKYVNLKENEESNRLGNLTGVYGVGMGQCPHFVLRFCLKNPEEKLKLNNFDWKKYSTANITVSFFGGIFVGMEFHRVAELPGIMLFQDPDLYKLSKFSKPRMGYFHKDELPAFTGKKSIF